MKKYQYLFGPVPSRRFGRSLGVDLTPYKTCSLDCVFCQLGRTREKTVSRKEYVPVNDVIAELEDWIESDGKADYITLSGTGEPTLHSGFGEVIDFIGENSPIPAALLTNGTMLYLPEVRKAASNASVVKVSLSAWNQKSFGWVNRPHPQLNFGQLLEGQKAFRAAFKGQLWLEVFLVKGMNSRPDDVRKIAALIREIKPDRIQLNTSIRPPAEDFVMPLSSSEMADLTHVFSPVAEVIAEFSLGSATAVEADQNTIFSMLQRRPCTMEDIADIFGLHINEVSKYLGILMQRDRIRAERKNRTIYYAAVRPDEEK
jgi:wyosine [tRNA(Phe)-imidazoG37] synthetase (radical SAM superfamily)